MKVVRQMRDGKEVWVDEFSGVIYAPITEIYVDPIVLPAQQAKEIADSVRYIIDTLHDDAEAAQILIEYALRPTVGD
jgi:hypothetical protein